MTFANPVFDQADKKQIAHDQGSCVRTVASKSGAYECFWTTFLPKGQVTVEGPFYDKANSTLAITGGTGVYAGTRGTMGLRSRAGGSKYDFVFHLTD